MDLGVEFLWSTPQKDCFQTSSEKNCGGFMFTKDCISETSVYSRARLLSRQFNFRAHTPGKSSIRPQRWIYTIYIYICLYIICSSTEFKCHNYRHWCQQEQEQEQKLQLFSFSLLLSPLPFFRCLLFSCCRKGLKAAIDSDRDRRAAWAAWMSHTE